MAGHTLHPGDRGNTDHDFPSLAEGVVIPHGIYDLQRNHGDVNLGTSHDTSEFACDSLRQWWQVYGRLAYPAATSLLILCDGGGRNSARTYLCKADPKSWCRTRARRCGSRTIHRTRRSTIRSSIACFRT